MGQLQQLTEARRQLGLALEVLCHDRWYDGQSSVTFCSVAFRATGQGAAARDRTK